MYGRASGFVRAAQYRVRGVTSPARHANNADLLRFTAATGVVVSHSYAIAGHQDREPIVRLSHGHSSIGALMVSAFFILSGYLITQSYQRRHDPIGFTFARLRRLWPALTVLVTLTVLVYGPLLTTLPLRGYFARRETWDYFRVLTLWRIPLTLPGVLEGSPYTIGVNGSLWTLMYEAGCYVVVLGLGLAGLLRPWVGAALLAGLVTIVVLVPEPTPWITFGLAFTAGAFWAVTDARPRLSWWGGLVAATLIMLALLAPRVLPLAVAGPGSYLVLGFVFHPIPSLARWAELVGGDLSYGVYIYAWPIQQVVWYCAPGPTMPTWLNFALSYPVILVAAKASWQWVERPWLRHRA